MIIEISISRDRNFIDCLVFVTSGFDMIIHLALND